MGYLRVQSGTVKYGRGPLKVSGQRADNEAVCGYAIFYSRVVSYLILPHEWLVAARLGAYESLVREYAGGLDDILELTQTDVEEITDQIKEKVKKRKFAERSSTPSSSRGVERRCPRSCSRYPALPLRICHLICNLSSLVVANVCTSLLLSAHRAARKEVAPPRRRPPPRPRPPPTCSAGRAQVTLPPRARRRSLARAFAITIAIAIVTPLRRRSLACARASARALAAPSFRHCSQRPPPTRAPTTVPIARADDRSDCARRRRADARADARALATAPARVPTPVPTPSHADAPPCRRSMPTPIARADAVPTPVLTPARWRLRRRPC